MSRSIHELRCKSNPDYIEGRFTIPTRKGKYKNSDRSKIAETRSYNQKRKEQCIKNNDFKCMYCSKDFYLKNNKKWFQLLKLHESFCCQNLNAYKARPVSEEVKKKLSQSQKNKKNTWTDEKRLKHSEVMRKVVSEKPKSYLGFNRGRVKEIEIDGIKVQGKWELHFYLWAKDKNLQPQKVIEGFPYTWNGPRKYFPDFYLPTKDIYVEIKGYETDRDISKWDQFPQKLVILKKEEIKRITSGSIESIDEFQYYTKSSNCL